MIKKKGAVLMLALLSLTVFIITAAYAATININDAEATAGAGTESITAPFDVTEISFDLDLTQDPACISQVKITVSNVNPAGGTFDVYVALHDAGNAILGDGGLDNIAINNGDTITISLTPCVEAGPTDSVTVIAVES